MINRVGSFALGMFIGIILTLLYVRVCIVNFSPPELGAATTESPVLTFDDLLDAIEWVESSGSLNPPPGKDGEVGPFQIKKIYADDVNRIIIKHRMKIPTFRYEDRYSRNKSRLMVDWGAGG